MILNFSLSEETTYVLRQTIDFLGSDVSNLSDSAVYELGDLFIGKASVKILLRHFQVS